jgi:hypothetical protein
MTPSLSSLWPTTNHQPGWTSMATATTSSTIFPSPTLHVLWRVWTCVYRSRKMKGTRCNSIWYLPKSFDSFQQRHTNSILNKAITPFKRWGVSEDQSRDVLP